MNLDVFPGWEAASVSRALPIFGYAKQLILTGRMVEPEEALERGLVNAVYEPEELMSAPGRLLRFHQRESLDGG